MKAYYIDADGRSRTHEFQKAPDGMWNVWGHAKLGDVFFVRRRRKPARFDVYPIEPKNNRLGNGRVFGTPVFSHADKQTALAWAQMRAALGFSEGEKA